MMSKTSCAFACSLTRSRKLPMMRGLSLLMRSFSAVPVSFTVVIGGRFNDHFTQCRQALSKAGHDPRNGLFFIQPRQIDGDVTQFRVRHEEAAR